MGPILIADDNPSTARLVQVTLEFEGFTTLIAHDGREALEKAGTCKPILLIMDVLMPELTGFEVLENMKKNPKTAGIPVIVLTAMSQMEDQKRAWELGVSDYIIKPFNPVRLLEVVKRIVRPPVESKPFPSTGAVPLTRVAIAGGNERAASILQTMLGNPRIQVVGVSTKNGNDPVVKLAGKLKIFITSDHDELCKLPNVDVLIESEPHTLNLERAHQLNPKLEVLRGYGATFMWGLLEEKEASEERSRSLVKELHTKVKELNALHESGKTLGSTMELETLLLYVLNLMKNLVNAESGIVFLEEKGKYLAQATHGDMALPKSVPPTVAKMVFRTGKPLVVSGVAAEIPGVQVILVPLAAKNKHIGFVALIFNQTIEISEADLTFLATLASQAGISIENARLYHDAKESKRQIETLLSKLIYAQEEERKRVSAEIHDSIAQSMVSAHTKVQTCQAVISKSPKEANAQLEDLKKLLAESIKEVRQIIFDLRPSTLDDLGLIPTLEHYVKKFQAENQKRVAFSSNVAKKKLSPVVEIAIYRIVQEALTNVKKHSKATHVEIHLEAHDGKLSLEVSDDGKGFNWDTVKEQERRGDSMGISGMMERAALLGGIFKIETIPEKGTHLFVEVPL